jgi:hypothetical protein
MVCFQEEVSDLKGWYAFRSFLVAFCTTQLPIPQDFLKPMCALWQNVHVNAHRQPPVGRFLAGPRSRDAWFTLRR